MKTKKTKKIEYKTESIDAFLARGGVINKIPTKVETVDKKQLSKVSNPASGYASIISFDDASLYNGEIKPKKETKKTKSKKPSFDFSALPTELQKTLLEQYGDQEDREV